METDWDKRSISYDSLQWARTAQLLQRFIEFSEIQMNHWVLDVGTGTGIVARQAGRYTDRVIGIDISKSMLDRARRAVPDVCFVNSDIRMLPFVDGSFDRILARMVFHHLTHGLTAALGECVRVLKPGGVLAVAEGIPPSSEVIEEYEAIFKLKEERLTFSPESLMDLLVKAGLTDCSLAFCIVPQVSVKKWLEDSQCDEGIVHKILQLHQQARPRFKEIYKMKEEDGDCLIDLKFCLIKGCKSAVIKE